MNPSINKIVLDLHKSESQANIFIRQADTVRKFYFIVTDGSNPYDLSGCTAVLRAKKPDNNTLYNHCEIIDNTIIYSVTSQTSNVAGEIDCEIKLYDAYYNVISTPRFTITVTESIFDDGELIESANEYQALLNAIEQTNNLNISVTTSNDNSIVYFTLTKKDGSTQVVAFSCANSSENPGGGYISEIVSAITMDQVNQAISSAISNMQSNYVNTALDVELENNNPVTSNCLYEVSQVFAARFSLIENRLNNLVDGDEVGW